MKRVLVAATVSVSLFLAGICLAFPKGEMKGTQHLQPSHSQEPAPPAPSAEEIERRKKEIEAAKKIVVATVNGVPITMDALIGVMNRIGARKGHGDGPGAVEEVKKEALDRLILQELAYQKARAEGLKVDPKNIESAMSNLRMNLGGEEEYRKFLDREGFAEKELMAQVERTLTLELIFAREVYGKIIIPEDEMRKEYEKEKHRFVKPEKIVAIDVVFFLKTDDKDSMAKAGAILKKIQEDKDRNPWNLVLDGTFIVRDYEVRKERDPELYNEVKKLKEGELSGVIKTADSLHILKLKEFSPEKQFTFEQVRGSIEGKFRVEAQQRRIKEWEGELRKEAKIEIIAANSSGEKTGAKGGQ